MATRQTFNPLFEIPLLGGVVHRRQQSAFNPLFEILGVVSIVFGGF